MNKLEEKMDKEFAQLQVTPRVYHFTKGIAPFTGVTIAISDRSPYARVDTVLHVALACSTNYCLELAYIRGPASRLLRYMEIKYQHPHGLAICNHLDQFSRKRGRIIAKGRLLKYLREEK